MIFLKRRRLVFILFLIVFVSGCGSKVPTFHISQETDFSFIKKVAVLPLENLSNDRFGSDIVRQAVISELLAGGIVDVSLPGEVAYTLEKMGIKSSTALSAEQLKNLSNTLKVQAVIVGSVERFGEERLGNVSAPVVSITLMMADANSGSIIWSASRTSGGASFWARHFGASTDTLSETTLKVVRETLQSLIKYAK